MSKDRSSGRATRVHLDTATLAFVGLFRAIATDRLPKTFWTTFNVTADNVQLPLHDAAVSTRMVIGTPVVRFVAVGDSRVRLATDLVMRDGPPPVSSPASPRSSAYRGT
jgi:hypothetical protein